VDKDNEIKKARSAMIKELVRKSDSDRPHGKNYLLVDKNGKASFRQPKELKAATGITGNFASAFTNSPVKKTKDGQLLISLPKLRGGVAKLEEELDGFIDSHPKETVDMPPEHVKTIQADMPPETTPKKVGFMPDLLAAESDDDEQDNNFMDYL
jgi:hypothetical protein